MYGLDLSAKLYSKNRACDAPPACFPITTMRVASAEETRTGPRCSAGLPILKPDVSIAWSYIAWSYIRWTASAALSQTGSSVFGKGKLMQRKRPALFRGWHFEDQIIVLCVRWHPQQHHPTADGATRRTCART